VELFGRLSTWTVKTNGIAASVKSTGGSVFNLNAHSQVSWTLAVRPIRLAVSRSTNGSSQFEGDGANKKLRAFSPCTRSRSRCSQAKARGITTFEDLKGNASRAVGDPGVPGSVPPPNR